MAQRRRQVEPRTFFLNETHELAPIQKGGGGALPKYEHILWAAKARALSASLEHVVDAIKESNDPLKGKRYFVLAAPEAKLKKRREDRSGKLKKVYEEKTDFGATHGRVFDRLGLDLLQVTEDGRAVVHADQARIDQLLKRSASLDKLGPREQSRWATIGEFETIPLQLRIDPDWLKSLKPHEPAEIVIELQPVLTRVEADDVLRAIADLLVQREGENLTGTGTDFSGRHWFRGRAAARSIRAIATDFYSVQAVHAPLYSIAAGKHRPARQVSAPATRTVTPVINADALPCVAIVDLGVPSKHRRLGDYRRGQFVHPDAPQSPIGDHGSLVASRAVFGERASPEELLSTTGQCSFFDVIVADYPDGTGRNHRVSDKLVLAAMEGVRGAAPDVRVFNLSFGDSRPLRALPEVERREKRLLMQDLDNFALKHDAVVVVAAGNSPPGLVPNPDYPNHFDDPRWALGPWACGFNTLVCGAFVSRLSTNGLVTSPGWPSPFTRVGPGLCDAPIPSFAAPGGNTDAAFNFRNGMGVWCLSASGLAEDHAGTSYAAPLLAREAALALDKLQDYCSPGAQPFAATVRAFLTIAAVPTTNDARVQSLAERTLGKGRTSVTRLTIPARGSAVMLWQGYVESPADTVRIQIPIPLSWLTVAQLPMLRLVVCYDPPVNEAAIATWACRRVSPVLRLRPDGPAARAPRGRHPSFPVIDRRYSLSRYKPKGELPSEGDIWLIELSYAEIAPYAPAIDFDSRQRVAFAAELFDAGSSAVDPQQALQALPIAATMTRLSVQPVPVRSPVIIRAR